MLAHCGLQHPVPVTKVPHQVVVFALDLHGSQAALLEQLNEHTKEMAQLGDKFCRQLLGSPSGFVPYWHVYDYNTRPKLRGHFGSFAAMQARLQQLQQAHGCTKVKVES